MSTIVEELSKLKNEHSVLAHEFRMRHTAFNVLDAEQSRKDRLLAAHKVLEKSVNAWSVSRNAALNGNVKDAAAAAEESRNLLNESKRLLSAINQEHNPDDQTNASAPAASSPEPKPSPTVVKPTPTIPKPSPKNDDAPPPAPADSDKATEDEPKGIDLEDVKFRRKVMGLIDEQVGPSFQAINQHFQAQANVDAINQPLVDLLASGEYTIEDLERALKIGRFVNGKFKRNRGKHTNAHDDQYEDDPRDHPQDQDGDHTDHDPHTKVMNLGADRKDAPQPERTR